KRKIGGQPGEARSDSNCRLRAAMFNNRLAPDQDPRGNVSLVLSGQVSCCCYVPCPLARAGLGR
ncbi:MAG: hypothetical protein ACFFCW_17010, partial [Candidatus Hodarchaeota archaeon]